MISTRTFLVAPLALTLVLILASVAALAGPPEPEALLAQLRNRDFAALNASLGELQQRYETRGEGDREIWETMHAFQLPDAATPDIDAWVKSGSNAYIPLLAAAMHYTGLGWRARGSGASDETSQARVDDSQKMFDRAFRYALTSLPLTAKPVVSHALLIDLARHRRGSGGLVAEHLARAIALDRNNFIARSRAIRTMQPRWGGSLAAMEAIVTEAKNMGLPAERLKRLEAEQLRLAGTDYELRNQLPKALELLDRSVAVFETSDAQLDRGRVLESRRQLPKAREALVRAVELNPGNATAHARLGYLLLRAGKQEPQAFESYKRAAKLGDGWSAGMYGWMLQSGARGIKKDPRGAFDWFELGARLGNVYATLKLGECYSTGVCGKDRIDGAAAERWLQKALDYGEMQAAINLGELFREGVLVPPDRARAARYFLTAADSSDPEIRALAYARLLDPRDPWNALLGLAQIIRHDVVALSMLAITLAMVLCLIGTVLYDRREEAQMKRGNPNASLIVPPRWPGIYFIAMLVMVTIGSPILFPHGQYLAGQYWLTLIVPITLFAFFAALSVWYFLISLNPRNRVGIDPDGIDFVAAGRKVRVTWKDITFARRLPDRSSRLGHVEGSISIEFGSIDGPVYTLDVMSNRLLAYGKLWRAIRSRIPEAAFADDAHTRVRSYADHKIGALSAFETPVELAVSLPRTIVLFCLVAVIGNGLFGAWLGMVATDAYLTGEDFLFASITYLAALMLVLVSLYFIYDFLTMRKGSIKLTREGVRYDSILASDAITWTEITSVQMSKDLQLLFQGGNKVLIVPGPFSWRRADRESICPILKEFLEQRGIQIEQKDFFAGFRRNRGCKVKRN